MKQINIAGVAADFIRAGAIVAAVLAIVLANASTLSVPASWVAWVSVTAGVVNAVVGILKPYAADLVAKVRGQ